MNISEIQIKMQQFPYKKITQKMLSEKFCLNLNVLNDEIKANTNTKLGNPFTHLEKNITPPSDICMENVHFDWFDRHVYTEEHFQSDLDIFRFDFMFVNHTMCLPCFALTGKLTQDFHYNNSCLQRAGVVKDLVSGTVVIKISCQFAC